MSRFWSCVLFVSNALVAADCIAQYPAKPVRLIVPAGPGTSPDVQARVVAQKLGDAWRQGVVVENLPGAAGNMGVERAAKSSADGYTILFATFGPLYINKTLYSKLSYDIERDFEPVSQVSRTANILVVRPSLEVRTVQELVAYGKANPGRLRYGAAGNGTSMHILGELFKMKAGIDALHVPYKSSAQMAADLAAGEFEFAFNNAAAVIPYLRGGRLRALAVTTEGRFTHAPELPAMGEAGLPQIVFDGGSGVVTPTGTPREIVERIYRDLTSALHTPAVREQFAAHWVEPVGSTPDEFRAHIRSETVRWAPIVRASGARLD